MPLHVHYPTLESGEFRDRLERLLLSGVALTSGRAPVPDAVEICVGGVPTEEELGAFSNLRALIIPWAGLPTATRELLGKYPELAVHNLHHNAAPVAEHAMALLLAVSRHLVTADQSLRRGDWSPRYGPPRSPLLAGRDALILGAGAVGRRLARACEGLALQPILIGREPRAGIHAVAELDALLPRGEVVLVALPGTPETDGLLDADRLACLPEGALLVNVGRATVIEERALFDALRSGRLAGAGIDVWYRYPENEEARGSTLPSDFPFHELDNIVMSPHRAGHGLATARLRAESLAEVLNAAARGETMPNRIDPRRGY